MTDSEIIDALGGTCAVADLCEVKPPSVSAWRERGIPNARRMFLKAVRPDVFGAPPNPQAGQAVGTLPANAEAAA